MEIRNTQLSDQQAALMTEWVVAANGWSEAAQAAVGAASELSRASRDLAGGGPPPDDASDTRDDGDLARNLLRLADNVEDETRELRDRYVATAANLDQHRSVLR